VVNIIVGFTLTLFVIRHLGKTGYGIWTLVGSFIGYYGLLDLGVGSAITRYVARYAGQSDEKSLNETASTGMAMFCGTGALAVVVSFFAAAPLARFFKVDPSHFDDFQRTVRLIGLPSVSLGERNWPTGNSWQVRWLCPNDAQKLFFH
jgi:O-antigen/teichoic acid export membrane protein